MKMLVIIVLILIAACSNKVEKIDKAIATVSATTSNPVCFWRKCYAATNYECDKKETMGRLNELMIEIQNFQSGILSHRCEEK